MSRLTRIYYPLSELLSLTMKGFYRLYLRYEIHTFMAEEIITAVWETLTNLEKLLVTGWIEVEETLSCIYPRQEWEGW